MFFYYQFLPLLLVVGLFEKLEFSGWKCWVEDLKESMACFLFSTLAETARQCLHSRRGGERRCSVHLQKLMKWEQGRNEREALYLPLSLVGLYFYKALQYLQVFLLAWQVQHVILSQRKKMMRRKLEYNGWFGCCGSSTCQKILQRSLRIVGCFVFKKLLGDISKKVR